MITTTISEYLQSYLTENLTGLAQNLDIHIAGESNEILPPCILIENAKAEEHEVLPEVYEVTLEIRLKTIAREDEGTSFADHVAMGKIIRDAINENDREKLLTYLNDTTDLYAYFVDGMGDETSSEDDTRITVFTIKIIALEEEKP